MRLQQDRDPVTTAEGIVVTRIDFYDQPCVRHGQGSQLGADLVGELARIPEADAAEHLPELGDRRSVGLHLSAQQLDAIGVVVQLQQPAASAVEQFDRVIDGRAVLAGQGRQLPLGLALLAGDVVDAAGDAAAGEEEDGEDDEHAQRQLPVHDDHHAERPVERPAVADVRGTAITYYDSRDEKGRDDVLVADGPEVLVPVGQ